MDNGIISASTFIATTREEILDCRTSIYMDFPMQRNYKKILDFKGKVAVVGIPCQLEDLKKYEKKYPEIRDKIEIKISLFCSGSSPRILIEKVLIKNKVNIKEIKSIIFKKGHWRGKTHIFMKNGNEIIFSYLYGLCIYRNLYFHTLNKCNSCQDQFGYNADICCGDLWLKEMKINPIKHTCIIAKNNKSASILKEAFQNKKITLKEIDEKKILKSQKRPLIYKFNSAEARKKTGQLFGIKYRGEIIEKSKWNHYIAGLLISINMKLSDSKIIFMVPQKLMFLYMGFVKFLLNF
jgi:coenzyme F420-reducing hydrogenase beta subunit